jgi:drug/metabolite transporter (DMT)-like permease
MNGFLSGVVAAMFLSLSGIASKEALKNEHSLDFSLVANAIGLILILPAAFFVSLAVSSEMLGVIYVGALFGSISNYLTFKALRHMEISVVMPLMNLTVIFTLLFGMLFVAEFPSSFALLGIFLIVVGGYILQLNQAPLDWRYPFRELKYSRYQHILFFGIICLSLAMVLGRIALKEVPSSTFLFYSYVFLTLNNLLLFLLLRREPLAESFRTMKQMFGWTFLGALLRLVSNFFFVYSVSVMYVAIAEAIKRLSTLFSVLLGGRVFKEEQLAWKSFASLIMIAGALLAAWGG